MIGECIPRLMALGISLEDAKALRRISMTLHTCHELECGNDHRADGRSNWTIPDREAGALKRLKAIMARYPTLSAFVQGDLRGASLYILWPGDVPSGENADAYYSRGIAVDK